VLAVSPLATQARLVSCPLPRALTRQSSPPGRHRSKPERPQPIGDSHERNGSNPQSMELPGAAASGPQESPNGRLQE